MVNIAILNTVLALGLTIGVPISLLFIKPRKRTFCIVFILVFLITVIQQSMTPTNDRNWRPSVARLPRVIRTGETFLIKNIRNFEYRTESDFTPRYYDKSYKLSDLQSLDYILSYWGGNTKIAHTILSFGFKDGSYLAVSVETRVSKEKEQSLLGGFFNQYELIYILADERDLLRLRTNFRKKEKEDVYLYRLKVKPENLRKIFINIVTRANALNDHPRFYNTLKHNCMTTLLADVREAKGKKYSFDPRFIYNGLSDRLLYENGAFFTGGFSFKDLRKHRYLNQYVTDKPDAEIHYSEKIRKPNTGIQ
jgi:hypothetical protein